ncbi:MAG: type II toxin-antitoxin system RelE/ParE family toxin [Betaproteobacteria bacterium]
MSVEWQGEQPELFFATRFGDAVYVLHAFKKKMPKTSRLDLELARQRYRTAREHSKGVNDG